MNFPNGLQKYLKRFNYILQQEHFMYKTTYEI